METLKAKCSNIVQAENRGTVMFTVVKDKKVETQIAISFINAKSVAKYEIGKEYTIEIKPAK